MHVKTKLERLGDFCVVNFMLRIEPKVQSSVCYPLVTGN